MWEWGLFLSLAGLRIFYKKKRSTKIALSRYEYRSQLIIKFEIISPNTRKNHYFTVRRNPIVLMGLN